jgi:hypothetical protein
MSKVQKKTAQTGSPTVRPTCAAPKHTDVPALLDPGFGDHATGFAMLALQALGASNAELRATIAAEGSAA